MLTIFSTPKPFRGHIGIIQRNAIESWKRIDPTVEIILFGDDDGAADTARDLDIRHVPHVERNEHGTKYLTSIFDQAQKTAQHQVLCYVNCDIVLMSDFRQALVQVCARYPQFLMVGRRWDTDITEALDFEETDWESRLRKKARHANHQRPSQWIDYFAFSRGLYLNNTPPFVIGRPSWDNWLLWKARDSNAAVVDASEFVLAVHQNHDYSYHPEGEAGVWKGKEALANAALLEGGRYYRTMEDAPLRLNATGIRANRLYWMARVMRRTDEIQARATWVFRNQFWHPILNATRHVRHAIGLRQKTFPLVRRREKNGEGTDS
jgi:hypothetical protein